MYYGPIGRMMSLAYSMIPGGNVFGDPRRTYAKKVVPRKCVLPGCEVEHTHNGGYCCAQHCKDHVRQMRKQGGL